MNKNNRHIKVPEGIIKKANDKGIRNEILYFFRFKAIHRHGYFPIDSYVSTISKSLSISESSVWRITKKLVVLGFIKKEKYGYRLISFDSLCSLMDYDISYYSELERKGRFKIYKFSIEEINSNLYKKIATEEIRTNLEKQKYQVKKSKYFKRFVKSKATQKEHSQANKCSTRIDIQTIFTTVDKLDHVKKQVKSKKITEMNEYLKAKGDEEIEQEFTNLDITLSNKGLCKLLGFKSTETAHKLQLELNRLGLILSRKRRLFIKSASPLEIRNFRKYFPDPSYILSRGVIMKILPNHITVL